MSSQITPQQFEKLTQLYINKINQLFESNQSNLKLKLGDDLGFVLTQDIVNKLINNVESLLKEGSIDEEKSQNMKDQINSETFFANIYASMFKQACNYLANQLPAQKGVAFLGELQDEDAFSKLLPLYFEYFGDDDNFTFIKAFVDGYKKEIDNIKLNPDPVVNILAN